MAIASPRSRLVPHNEVSHEAKSVLAFVCAVAFVAAPPAAIADQPPGQWGDEGEPGNEGGAGGNPDGGQLPGLLGDEGQPGNQGG